MAKEIREPFLGLLALIIVSLGLYGLVRVSSNAANSNGPLIQSADLGGSDHYLYAATYLTKAGWSSMLGLNNSQNHPITARITLFNKQGRELNTPAMEITLGPRQNHGFNIADWIGNRNGFDQGSLVVFFHGPSMALGVQEIITDAEHSLNFDVHLTEYDDFKSNRAEGLWWTLKEESEAKVYIANTRDSASNVTPVFYVRGESHQGETINLAGH